jgi:tetraacyldisaccharide 4'-kinase
MLRAAVARALERGIDPGLPWAARALEAPWARAVRLARPLRTPLPALCVAGATLGGSGATPVAVAMSRALAESGARVAFVGHAYRARPGAARWVREDDALAQVGDEALLAARSLQGLARVVVGPTRQAALDLVAGAADVVVLDGVVALAEPRAPTRSLLVVDAARPWGSGRCPPLGDLRAPPAALLAAADRVLALGPLAGEDELPRDPAWVSVPRTLTATGPDGPRPLRELAGARVGLATCLARPGRLLRALRSEGVHVTVHARGADHGPAPAYPDVHAAGPAFDVDAWLATEKCALHLEASRAWVGIPRLVLRQSLAVSGAWAAGLA